MKIFRVAKILCLYWNIFVTSTIITERTKTISLLAAGLWIVIAENLVANFIRLAQDAQRVTEILQAKLQIEKNRFFVVFLCDAFSAYMKHEILQHKLTESQIDAPFSVWGNDSYRQYVSVFGIPIRFSRLLYKKRLFHLFVLYLRGLKELNHPFFKTLG